jgi:hypothetical protein
MERVLTYIETKEIVFLLKNGEWAFPVKVESNKTKNCSFRSAPSNVNVLGTDWDKNEVEVSEDKMIEDVLNKGRRTRSVSLSQPIPNLRGKNSKDVVAVYVLSK